MSYPASQDVVVFNTDPENFYLQTEVYDVINPGNEQEERIRVTDPDKLNSDNKMTFTNNGNMNVVLRNGKYCISEDNGTNLNDGTRIYAGGSWEMPLALLTINS